MKLKLDNGQVLSIKLVRDHTGDIDVVVTKVDGEPEDSGILVTLKSNGKFKRVGYVSSDVKVELDKDGKIKEEK